MEKPKIFVREGYIVATAKDTLKSFKAEYEVLQETDIYTSIGNIFIVLIKKAGNALIAVPSCILDMEKVVDLLEKMDINKIFIDGAFFRHSLAKVSDATIFVVGANLNSNIERVIDDAKLTVLKFELKKPEYDIKEYIDSNSVCLIKEGEKTLKFPFSTILGNTEKMLTSKNRKYEILYLPKSLTNDFLEKLVEKRHDFCFDIVLESPVSIQLNFSNTSNLFKLKNRIFVNNPINLVAVCYNPYSPRGYEFPNEEFKNKLEKVLNRKVYNVVKEVSNE